MENTLTAQQAIEVMTIEAHKLGADANDANGIVRGIVAANLPNRPDAQFSTWFCICCNLADIKARGEGFDNQVHMAYARAEWKVKGIVPRCESCGCSRGDVSSLNADNGNHPDPICCEVVINA